MVVFFDIDGTLVDDGTQIIPESALEAVTRLCRNGHIPVINTGRPYTHVDPRIRAMDFRGYICGCGMQVRYEDRWLFHRRTEIEVCRKTVEAVRECNMQVLYEQEEGGILTDGIWSSHPGCVLEAARMAAKGNPTLDIGSLPEPRFLKFVTLDGENSNREEFFRRVSPWFTVVVRAHTLVEYMGKGCSKAAGMEILLRELGIPGEETLAIGDSANDLPMFGAAAHTVCMGNGAENVKQQAEFVTDSVLEDGVYKALEHFHLI